MRHELEFDPLGIDDKVHRLIVQPGPINDA
jgi:hypothetical protein